MLHISPSPFPFSLPVNRLLCPFDCSKDLLSMSIIVFCCFSLFLLCFRSEFLLLVGIKIAFFFFFHLVVLTSLFYLFVRRI